MGVLVGLLIFFSSFVIPAVKAVLLVSLEHSKRCAIFTKYPHTTLIDKYIDLLTRKVWETIH